MSALNHLVTKCSITVKATCQTHVLLIRSSKAKELYETVKEKLSKDIKEFDIKDFKVIKVVGAGS